MVLFCSGVGVLSYAFFSKNEQKKKNKTYFFFIDMSKMKVVKKKKNNSCLFQKEKNPPTIKQVSADIAVYLHLFAFTDFASM